MISKQSRTGLTPVSASVRETVSSSFGSSSSEAERLTWRIRAAAEAVVAPGGELRAGGAQGPAADALHQPGALGDRDEERGRDGLVAGTVPAQERLDADDLTAAALDERLEDDAQLILGEGLAEGGCELDLAAAQLLASRFPRARVLGHPAPSA